MKTVEIIFFVFLVPENQISKVNCDTPAIQCIIEIH